MSNNRLFALSDQHFGHQNIIKYCNRPVLTADEDIERMIKGHNSVVTNDDTIVIVGDVFVSNYGRSKAKEITSELKGKKILVKGNHDINENQWFLDLGFESVYNIMRIQNFMFCHYPDNPKVLDYCRENDLTLVSGHTHKVYNFNDGIKRINVAVDVVGVVPVRLL